MSFLPGEERKLEAEGWSAQWIADLRSIIAMREERGVSLIWPNEVDRHLAAAGFAVDDRLRWMLELALYLAYQHDVVLDLSRFGKPTGNAFAEAFNGRVRAECLNAYWFLSLDDARVKCEAWRRDYNEHRPHSALGNQTPMERAFSSGQACLP